jgi:addiction module toxin component, YafQ family/addiction module toxin, RelE/StbE family
MLKLEFTNKFKKDFKRMLSRGCKEEHFDEVVKMLINEIPLPAKYKDHSLSGNYKDFKECHIEPDWLLIYRIEAEILTLVLSRTGTHSDLF